MSQTQDKTGLSTVKTDEGEFTVREDGTVVDVAKSRLSDFWKFEDYWAIWLGFIILLVGYFCFAAPGPRAEIEAKFAKAEATLTAEAARAPFKTVDWITANNTKAGITGRSNKAGTFLSTYLATPSRWDTNPIGSFFLSEADAKARSAGKAEAYAQAQANTTAALTLARETEAAAAAANFADEALNSAAQLAAEKWNDAQKKEASAKTAANVKPFNRLTTIPLLGIVIGLLFTIGMAIMGHNPIKFLIGYVGVFIVAVIAMCVGQQTQMNNYGIGAEVWAIAIGMIIANTVGTPKWVLPGCQVEFIIKTALVVLGAEILLSNILAIGVPGLFVTWVCCPVVLICTFLFGQKVLKIESKTLNMVLSADMSVCGTSAAIATAAACKAKKEELSLAVGISLFFTAIMMVVMPFGIRALGLDQVLAGAWIGGVIDTTGAVAASGAILGPTAMSVAATVKMIQNVLIGITAFGVAIYWITVVDRQAGVPINPFEIWHRFPKFVIGFLLASVFFSYLSASFGSSVGLAAVDNGVVRGLSSPIRSWLFALAFTAIGLSTNFRALSKHLKGGKPVILYIFGQSLQILLTLTMAYIMFTIVFPEVRQGLLGN